MHWTPTPPPTPTPTPANLDIFRTPFIRKGVFDLRIIEYQCRDACQMGVTEHIFKHFEYI